MEEILTNLEVKTVHQADLWPMMDVNIQAMKGSRDPQHREKARDYVEQKLQAIATGELVVKPPFSDEQITEYQQACEDFVAHPAPFTPPSNRVNQAIVQDYLRQLS